MSIVLNIPEHKCICCSLPPGNPEAISTGCGLAEVYYGVTDELGQRPDLINYLSVNERSKAEKILSSKDRETYLWTHVLLRSIISKKLNVSPMEISIIIDVNNKPVLEDDQLSFNITHTRNSFAIAVSDQRYVGIDMERNVPDFNFISIIDSFFSYRERQFILNTGRESGNRFFLLWTRKEALLKAFGIGILTDLKQVEVCMKENFLKKELFDQCGYSLSCDNYIYSEEISDYILSVALPVKSEIKLFKIDRSNIESYL